ncbi:hypothetical protein N9S30_00300 [bacterium]|nr:hypothetical protein [bacterium]
MVAGVRIQEIRSAFLGGGDMPMNDIPDAAQCCMATTECACEGKEPNWVLHGTQQACYNCGAVRTGVVEVGVTWEEECRLQGNPEEELGLETDDRKIYCLLPCKPRGQCAHCLHSFNSKKPPVKNLLSEAHQSILLDPELHHPLQSNVAHLDELLDAGVYTPAQLVQSKDANTKTIRDMRKTMATATNLFGKKLKEVQAAHLVSFSGETSDSMYLKLGEFVAVLKARAVAIQEADKMGVLLQAANQAAQVKKDLETYLADKTPPKNTDPPPSHDSDIKQTLPERFILELYHRDRAGLFQQAVAFAKNDQSRKSQFQSFALAADKRELIKDIFNGLNNNPAGFCCNNPTCKSKTNVGLFLVTGKCSFKYGDLFRQFKVAAVIADIGDVVLPGMARWSFRDKVLTEAQRMFWASDFFETRVEGTLSTIQNVIYGSEFAHIGCNFDAGYMNRLCMYSAVKFFDIYVAPLFDPKNKNDSFWRACFDAFCEQKATATADSIAIVKLLEADAIQRCASATFENDAVWIQEMAKHQTHNLDYMKGCFVEDRRRFLKEKAVVTKVSTACSFNFLKDSVLNASEFGTIVREGDPNPANKRLIKNTYHSVDGVRWSYVFDRMPSIKGASAMRFLCDEREQPYVANVPSSGAQPVEDKSRRDALPTTKVGELTKLATQLEVAIALLVCGTRHSRATFIGFVGLSAASRRNIDQRYEHDVFADAVSTNKIAIEDLRNRPAMTEFLQRVLTFVELRLVDVRAKKDQVADKVHPACVDTIKTPEDEWVVEQSAKIRRLDDRIKCLEKFESTTMRFLRVYVDALDRCGESEGDINLLKESSKFQSARLVTNRKEIESINICARGTPTRPLSVALIPSTNQGKGILSIKATAELESAFERAIEISLTSSHAHCTEIATRITMQYLSPTMERLNNGRRDTFLCGESQIGRRPEEIARLDMAGSFHRVLMSVPNDERAVDLFRRVYKTTLAPIDSDAAAGYLKLMTNALNSDDPVSSPVLRNSTVVRFLAEAAFLWGSVREKRCAKTILENHYDFNKNEFVDTPNKPLVAYADDTPTMPAHEEEHHLQPELFQRFHAAEGLLEAAEEAMRERGRREDALHQRYPSLKPVRFDEAAAARRKKKSERDPDDVIVNSHMDDADKEMHYEEFGVVPASERE